MLVYYCINMVKHKKVWFSNKVESTLFQERREYARARRLLVYYCIWSNIKKFDFPTKLKVHFLRTEGVCGVLSSATRCSSLDDMTSRQHHPHHHCNESLLFFARPGAYREINMWRGQLERFVSYHKTNNQQTCEGIENKYWKSRRIC